MGDISGAATHAERSAAIMYSLDLTEHPNTRTMADDLAYFWDRCGHRDKAARLRSGDVSDLLPVIAQVEAEHRAWVAEGPNTRDFGPSSRFT